MAKSQKLKLLLAVSITLLLVILTPMKVSWAGSQFQTVPTAKRSQEPKTPTQPGNPPIDTPVQPGTVVVVTVIPTITGTQLPAGSKTLTPNTTFTITLTPSFPTKLVQPTTPNTPVPLFTPTLKGQPQSASTSTPTRVNSPSSQPAAPPDLSSILCCLAVPGVLIIILFILLRRRHRHQSGSDPG